MMEDVLKVALIQPSTDNQMAWNVHSDHYPYMHPFEAARTWKQIRICLNQFANMPLSAQPDIIVIPELNVARQYQSQLRLLARYTHALIIAGLDYRWVGGQLENKAVVEIPERWPKKLGNPHRIKFEFGKKNYARLEGEYAKGPLDEGHDNSDVLPLWKAHSSIYLLNTGVLGRIGFAICADFYDIERFAIYKGRIQHLIILAFNQDIKSFYFLAESISRLVYCNVIICNTGYYGGSVCFTPSKAEYARYRYKHEGQDLFTSQIVELPVRNLILAQKEGKSGLGKFKTPPPGYEYAYQDEEC